MLTMIFFMALIWVVWKMFVWWLKAMWGIAKLVCMLLLPLLIVSLFLAGLIYIALPLLIIVGLAAMIGEKMEG